MKKNVCETISIEKKTLAVMVMIAAITTIIFLVYAIISPRMNYDSGSAPMISYFTIQSNIIMAAWLVMVSLNMMTTSNIFKSVVNIRISAMFTTYILVTGTIYWVILVPIFSADPNNLSWLFSASNIWLHTTTPVIALLMHNYIKSFSGENKPAFNIAFFFIYPALYVIMAILFAVKGIYLYPMFNPNMMGGWVGVAFGLLAILAAFTGVYVFLLRGLKRKRNQKDKTDAEI